MSGCTVAEGVVVCSPTRFVFRRVLHCGHCKTRRRHVVEAFVWYDPFVTCCTCGRDRISGRPHPKRAARAAQAWRDARPRAEVEAAFRAEVEVYTTTPDDEGGESWT